MLGLAAPVGRLLASSREVMGRIAKGLRIESLDAGFRRRFWPKVPEGLGQIACWPWKAATNNKGYGFIWSRAHGGPILAHQASYAMTRGAVPAGCEIIHTCDNPACVNPWHLKEATHAENMADKVRKGRQARGHGAKILAGMRLGEAHPKAKLTDAQVENIRRARASGETTIALAREYGVSHQLVSQIASGRSRKHSGKTLPGEES
jgi:hypothetical protein